MKKIYLLFVSITILSCTEEATQVSKINFDLAAVIQTQINELSKSKPIVSKTVFLNEQKEELSTKDIDWTKELALFLEADLNKQAYQKSYEVSKTDFTEYYQLKASENLPVKSLKLFFDKNKNLTHAEGILETKNYLYESTKNLRFNLANNKLVSYEINTSQELFIGKKKFFRVIGIINK